MMISDSIIPHIWTLANIVPIPKTTKTIDKGISCRSISLLSVIAKIPEKSLLPYITANTPTQHGYKNTTLYSDGTTYIKQYHSKGDQTNGFPLLEQLL